MNRLLIHIILASLFFACSQYSDSAPSQNEAAPAEEQAKQKGQTFEWAEEQRLEDNEELEVENGLVELEDQEYPSGGLANQKNYEEQFVKGYAKQKMEDFFDLWQMYADSQTEEVMRKIVKEELDKLITSEAWTEIATLSFSDKADLGKVKLLDLEFNEAAYQVYFSFKLNGTKYKGQAKLGSQVMEIGEVWFFSILSIE
ncbi:MAG: hypothetical protein ACI9O4_001840 [Chitinophagales bacterium]|jgi:hypothetical protein